MQQTSTQKECREKEIKKKERVECRPSNTYQGKKVIKWHGKKKKRGKKSPVEKLKNKGKKKLLKQTKADIHSRSRVDNLNLQKQKQIATQQSWPMTTEKLGASFMNNRDG